MSGQPALVCSDLHKRFGRAGAEVGPISFSVSPGEVFGLLGPDGAGKTTTLRMLCGILQPSSGNGAVLDFDLLRQPEEIKERIGYMSQRFSLYGDLTVAENIEFFADIFRVPLRERPARSAELLTASRLAPFRNRRAENLSGGMKQKLALVCTLIHTPQVLILDEPTTGVDPVSRRDFWQILYGLVGQGMTLIVSTPYMDEAERCNRIAMMHRGRMLLCNTPAAVRHAFPGTVLEVHTECSWKARAALQKLPGVLLAEAFGDRLHVVVDGPERRADIERLLATEGVKFQSIRQVQPGLEDVFVTMMQEQGSGRAAGN